MNVSTVSTPFTSPTEDPCETDVTNVAIHSVTLLISLCGLFGNGAVLSLLSLELINSRIFDLAVTDFTFLLFTGPSALLFLVEDLSCSPVVPLGYLNFLFQLSVVCQYWVLCWLTDVVIATGIVKLCNLLGHYSLSERLLWVVSGIEFWAFFILTTVIPTVTLLCPSHEQQQCRAAVISIFTVMLLLRAAPTVISRIIKFIKAKCGSQQQQLKRRDIAVCLTVLFTLLLLLWNFLEQLGYTPLSSKIFLLLTCINSTIKPFIYFVVGRCWRPCSVGSCWRPCSFGTLRESLRRVFEEPEGNTAHSNDGTMDTVL
ncbi:mas-related G-protein coupled receptor member H-like [Malurus melanocephalus]|uniref:mas-related G-protein coupled receptor member H-like n=1 Tax=Malurus melanocephalus TaxID=175006 RepID=UPI0025481EC4|nr:mas-related G-protein coupled receptor member H-like [Malurus melanocephalus]